MCVTIKASNTPRLDTKEIYTSILTLTLRHSLKMLKGLLLVLFLPMLTHSSPTGALSDVVAAGHVGNQVYLSSIAHTGQSHNQSPPERGVRGPVGNQVQSSFVAHPSQSHNRIPLVWGVSGPVGDRAGPSLIYGSRHVPHLTVRPRELRPVEDRAGPSLITRSRPVPHPPLPPHQLSMDKGGPVGDRAGPSLIYGSRPVQHPQPRHPRELNIHSRSDDVSVADKMESE
ncbi:uncharacterized protein LOC119975596 [Scyliorhinus canicula]|uniref:uncharacterized protein LOC119975596 n=1 Tax=Scyliorhinus canicula TaxID=7830 RepID=UPI0018F6676B|nr:uncharacterized protein LOC119975596 [Scyliorhinus canicula]